MVRTIDIIRAKVNKAAEARPESPMGDLAGDLRQHLSLCQEILALVEKEGQAWRAAEPAELSRYLPVKKDLLPRLTLMLDRIRQHRSVWQQLSPVERAKHSEVGPLIRHNQELVMKIIMLDRENEQVLLRRGLMPPAQLPPANRQRPHYVADLYRRQGNTTE
jgi:hypothetical protein